MNAYGYLGRGYGATPIAASLAPSVLQQNAGSLVPRFSTKPATTPSSTQTEIADQQEKVRGHSSQTMQWGLMAAVLVVGVAAVGSFVVYRRKTPTRKNFRRRSRR